MHECSHCGGTGKRKLGVAVQSIEEIRTRVDNDLTELAERMGELQSRAEMAGIEFGEYVVRIEAGNYLTDNIAGIMADSLEGDLGNIEQEVDAVRSVLRDYEESSMDLQAALEEKDDA